MKLLITGGAGFIGTNHVHHLMANTDDQIVVLDALTYAGTSANLSAHEDDPRFTFVEGDICDREVVVAAMTGCDAVIHFAAESHVDRSIAGSEPFTRTNCLGTTVLCDVTLQLGIARFLHISTDEVYGSIEVGSFSETDRLTPRSPYSASKAGSDLIALSYHVTHGLPVVVTRCSNNFGPYQYPEKLIPRFVTNLFQGRKVPLMGAGDNVRDWIHVDDHNRGVDLVFHEGVAGEVYNLGAHNELTNRQLTDKILALCGHDESMIETIEHRKGHDFRYSVDTSKIEALGWSPRREIDEALAETVAWYRDNTDWWEPLKARAETLSA